MSETNLSLPWYQKWFDENYLLLYQHRDLKDAKKQVKLILKTLNPLMENSILDLACGEGRYTYLFKALGYKIIGLDLSEALLKYGQEKYLILDLVRGDMRAIPGTFDIILSLFTSFGYFEKKEENQQVISSVHASLKAGGLFWLDFLNHHYVKEHLDQKSLTQLPNGIEVTETRAITNGRVVKEISFIRNGQQQRYFESVALFTRSDLVEILQNTGMKILHSFGDYEGNSWDEFSPRTILVAERKK